jgi:two-component system, LuxR family, response regulator FixJ
MPTIYIIAEIQRERDAIAALVSQECRSLVAFRDVSAFVADKDPSEPGCVILDLPRANAGALPQLREMLEPLPIIVISSHADVARAVQAMKQGAADFLERPIDQERLISSVRAGIDCSRARMARAHRKRELIARYDTLSLREKDVVGAILAGRPNREVASTLGIRPRTVETHRANAMVKLGARHLPDLVRIWLDLEADQPH